MRAHAQLTSRPCLAGLAPLLHTPSNGAPSAPSPYAISLAAAPAPRRRRSGTATATPSGARPTPTRGGRTWGAAAPTSGASSPAAPSRWSAGRRARAASTGGAAAVQGAEAQGYEHRDREVRRRLGAAEGRARARLAGAAGAPHYVAAPAASSASLWSSCAATAGASAPIPLPCKAARPATFAARAPPSHRAARRAWPALLAPRSRTRTTQVGLGQG